MHKFCVCFQQLTAAEMQNPAEYFQVLQEAAPHDFSDIMPRQRERCDAMRTLRSSAGQTEFPLCSSSLQLLCAGSRKPPAAAGASQASRQTLTADWPFSTRGVLERARRDYKLDTAVSCRDKKQTEEEKKCIPEFK